MILDYYNENALRSYPLDIQSSMPTDVLVGMTLTTTSLDPYYIARVVGTGSVVTVEIGQSGNIVAVASSPVTTSGLYTPIPLTVSTPELSGFVVVGPSTAAGTWEFTAESGRISNAAVNIVGESAYATINDISGVVQLTSGNTDLIFEVVNDNVVRVYLADEVLSRYTTDCDSAIELNSCGRPVVRKINGVTPDDQGRIFVELRNAE